MAAFLTTDGVSSEIKKVISDAESQVTLISPKFALPAPLFEQLKLAQKKGVDITLVYDKADFTDDQRLWIIESRNLHLYHFRALHANCYFNDDRMIITSMGLSEYSTRNYREMGILVRRGRDKELFKKAVTETDSILAAAKKLDPIKDDLPSGESFLARELVSDVERTKEDIRNTVSFFKDDLERTMADIKAGAEFLKRDLEKTMEDLNTEITLRSKETGKKPKSSS